MADRFFAEAKVVQRKAVVDHREVPDAVEKPSARAAGAGRSTGVTASASRGVNGKNSSLARVRPPDATPAGYGRGGATWHPVLALGPAPGPRLWAGDAHLSVVPTGLPAHHCRHHPGVGDHAYLAASPAGLRSPSHCPGPWSPSMLRVRLSRRPVASSHRRRAC